MSSNTDWLVAIDAGGTRSVCRVLDRAGKELGRGEGPAANPQNGGVSQACDSIARAVAAALPASTPVAGVSAGVAGVGFDRSARRALETSLAERLDAPCWIVGDLDIAHTAALAGRPGTVAIAGTGSVVVGTNARGDRHVAGGHGPLVGDPGSAYSIALAGVRAAALCEDEVGPPTALLAAVREHWDVGSSRVASALTGRPVHEIAAFAREVARCAAARDDEARGVLTRAGHELGELTGRVAQLTRAAADGPLLVSFQGSVLSRNEFVRAAFGDALANRVPDADLCAPAHEPVVGAYMHGCQHLGWPVSNAVVVA